jgi:hypothetical protein
VLGFKSDAKSLRGAEQRLLNQAVPPSFIDDIERNREIPLTFTWTAPRDGVVLERNVVPGMRVIPGEVLFRIADHTVVWALIEVAERDLGAVAADQSVTVRVRSYPDKTFTGKVALVYPHLMASTRTVRVRVELPNHDGLLLPDMYVEAEIETGGNEPVLASRPRSPGFTSYPCRSARPAKRYTPGSVDGSCSMGEAIVSMPSGAMSIRLAKRTANSASPFLVSAFASRNS